MKKKNSAQTNRLATIALAAALAFAQGCAPNSSGDDDIAAAAVLLTTGAGSTDLSTTQFDCSAQSASVPSGVVVADTVVSAPSQTGTGFGNTACATNGVRGLGHVNGSLDVFSLTGSGSGASMVLEVSGMKITNGTGIDFMVFENPFSYDGIGAENFIEAVIVEVSRDNVNYCGFNPDYTAANETVHSRVKTDWSRFAGRSTVLYNQDTNALNATDIFDETKAGGDGFNLDDLSDSNAFSTGCNTTVRNDIQTNGVVYFRLTAATSRVNADTGANFVDGSNGGGPDIDGIIARYAQTR